ncbi:MAG: EamA family transporter [Lachnospiraceae bacterium]|nr:EamA family transporter [Lachnospiraceae bacterium]
MGNIRVKKIIYSALLLLVGMIWGMAFVVVKDMTGSVPPLYMMAFRFFISFPVGVLIVVFKKTALSKRALIDGFFLGISFFLAYAFQTYGVKYTTAGKNAFLTTIYLVLVPFLGYIFYKTKLHPVHLAGAALAVAGVGLLTLGGEGGFNFGDFLTILCSICFAVQIILMSHFVARSDAMLLNVVQLGVVALFSWLFAPVLDGKMSEVVTFSSGMWLGLIYLGVLSTFFAEAVQLLALKYLRPVVATILMSTESLFGVLASAIFLGERMTSRMLAGCALTFLAVLLAELGELNLNDVFLPDEECSSSYELDYEGLYKAGKRGLIFDIDNTLVPHGAPADERSIELFKRLHAIGFSTLLLSNNGRKRVAPFAEAVSSDYICNAAKPAKKGYLSALERLGCTVDEALFIGDQLFTDILGAKRAGISNVFVHKIDRKEEIQIVLKRIPEKMLFHGWRKSGKIGEDSRDERGSE